MRLYVTIVRSNNPHPEQDPVVLLNGGPGGSSRGMLEAGERADLRDAILAERDLIVFDQRGTGASKPALNCPDFDQATIHSLLSNDDSRTRRDRFVAAALACESNWCVPAINLKAFNTIESAADIDDLRRALGYDEVNLYGISYGTRLALVAMRDRPDGLRSVVLDSTVPVQISQYAEGIENTAHAFDLLFERVAADPAASPAFPRLARRIHANGRAIECRFRLGDVSAPANRRRDPPAGHRGAAHRCSLQSLLLDRRDTNAAGGDMGRSASQSTLVSSMW